MATGPEVGAGADQGFDGVPAGDEFVDEIGADEPGGAGDEALHSGWLCRSGRPGSKRKAKRRRDSGRAARGPTSGWRHGPDVACSPAMNEWIAGYVAAQKAALDSIPTDAVARLIGVLQTALREDRQVFVFGNGGSAANASHFATDLGKGSSDKLARKSSTNPSPFDARQRAAFGTARSPSTASPSNKPVSRWQRFAAFPGEQPPMGIRQRRRAKCRAAPRSA